MSPQRSHSLSGLAPFVISALSVIGVLSSCATIKTAPERGSEEIHGRAVLPVPTHSNVDGSSGVLLSYEFEGVKSPAFSECRLRLVKRDSAKSFFLNLKAANRSAFEAVEPGRYDVTRMGCGLVRVAELDSIYPNGLFVQQGAVSYVGKLIFVFGSKGMEEVKKSPRSTSAQAFRDALTSLPDSSVIISAFSGQPMSEVMARAVTDDLRDGFDLRGTGIKDASTALVPLLERLKSCDQMAAKEDALRFGRIDYRARYVGGTFKEFIDRRDDNAFTDSLRNCIAESIIGFRPVEKSAVEIQVVY